MYLFNSEKPHQGWVNKNCMYVCMSSLGFCWHKFCLLLDFMLSGAQHSQIN